MYKIWEGLFQKKSKEGGRGFEHIILFSKSLLQFLDLSLYPFKNSGENKLSPLEILQNCVTPFNPRSKLRPMEILHYFFLKTLDNSTSFLIDPWHFHMFFLQYRIPLEISCPCNPVWIFSEIENSLIDMRLMKAEVALQMCF